MVMAQVEKAEKERRKLDEGVEGRWKRGGSCLSERYLPLKDSTNGERSSRLNLRAEPIDC